MNIYKKYKKFYCAFRGKKGVLGFSHFGRPIYYFSVKKTDYPKIIIQYSIHAREYITAALALKQIKNFYNKGKRGHIIFIPIVNPDGVIIALNKNPLYKANGRGVDLNVNFDAKWGKGASNVLIAGAENYIGEGPFSESETVALRDFTYLIKPNATISYHSKGEEIYFEFEQDSERYNRDKNLAEKVSLVTGYAIKSTPFSCGGYKDWCIKELKIPALTIEVGCDKLKHPIKKLGDIYKKNEKVIDVITDFFRGE